MRLKHFIPVALAFFVSDSYSQFSDDEIRTKISNSDQNTLLKDNSHLIQEGFLYQAEWVVDKLLTFQPESPNYNYRKGFLVLEIRKDHKAAIPFLQKAITDTKPHFDAFNTHENSAPADAYFYLASCYHLNNEIELALEMYQKFLDNTYSKSSLIPQTTIRIAQCEVAKRSISNPVNVSLLNLGNAVNSPYPDYSPVVSLDGSALYFSSKRPWEGGKTDNLRDPALNQYPEDIYVSYMDFDSEWTEAIRLDFCQPKRNEATVAISGDERRIYLYEDSTGSGDIYYSDFYSQKFNEISLLNEPGVNSPYWETHCSMNIDQNELYFSSDRPGGLGGRDIYYCKKSDNGLWSEPFNMGSEINTPQDEDSPFISVDGKQLYFASNSAKSMGGFDIFLSQRKNDGTWNVPNNMGYPFNSTNDDIFYTTTIDGLRGYLTSFRSDGKGEKDIYEIKNDFLGLKSLAVLKGLIRTMDNTPLPEDIQISMELTCTDCGENSAKRIIYPRLRDGIFITDLRPCHTYELTYVNASDKVNLYKNSFKTDCTDSYQEIYKEVILDKVRKTIIPVTNYTLDGLIVDNNNSLPIKGARLEVFDRKSNSIVATVNTLEDGRFKLDILKDKTYGDSLNYTFKISAMNYLTKSFELSAILQNEEKMNLVIRLDMSTPGADLANLFDIKPIYFDFNKSNIRPDAKIELDKIVKIMNDNPTLVIEFGSHTDCRGTEIYNKALSERRAKSSAAYIKSRISDPSRIYGTGYGESKPLNTCECEGDKISQCSSEQHQANRRTEFKIIGK